MTTATTKPTIKALRDEIDRLGITPDSAGCPLDELLRTARDQDDPFGYLAIHVGPDAAPIAASRETATADRETKPPAEEIKLPAGETPAAVDPFAPAVASQAPSLVSVVVPLSRASLAKSYVSRHVEVRLSAEQAAMLRRLHLALDAEGARLADGRRVIRPADAAKWLLDQIFARSQATASGE